jgi:hypothetical protein
VVSEKGGKSEKLRMALSQMAEFLGAYRLPNSVFGNAEADTITDVVVFRKYGADATTKIEELMAQSPETLIQANVLWGEFIQGHYFQGEGKRFVLGEFQAKDPTKYRDVDRVISDQSVPNIAKLLRKFPGSRVDWKLLDATETEPIAYNNGDSIVLAGQTLEMRDGVWVPVGAGQDTSGLEALASSLATPWPPSITQSPWRRHRPTPRCCRTRAACWTRLSGWPRCCQRSASRRKARKACSGAPAAPVWPLST